MDTDAEKQKLEDAKAYVKAWLDHPITREIIKDNQEQQQGLITNICEQQVQDLGTLFAFPEMKGHLRGLRRFQALVDDKLDEIETQLKELNE